MLLNNWDSQIVLKLHEMSSSIKLGWLIAIEDSPSEAKYEITK